MEEFEILKRQFGASNCGVIRYAPLTFTEQGIAMLSSVLNSSTAIKVNIRIIRVFTKMRKLFADTEDIKLELAEIKKKLNSNRKNIELVFDYLDHLIGKADGAESRRKIGFKSN